MSYRDGQGAGGGKSSLGYLLGDPRAGDPALNSAASPAAKTKLAQAKIGVSGVELLTELRTMTLPELRSVCRSNGISPAGSKSTLFDRLTEAIQNGQDITKPAGPAALPTTIDTAAAGAKSLVNDMKQIMNPTSPPAPAGTTPKTPAAPPTTPATPAAPFIPGETKIEDAIAAGRRGQYVPKGEEPFGTERTTSATTTDAASAKKHRVVAPFGTALAPGEEPIPSPPWDPAWEEPAPPARRSLMRDAVDADEGAPEEAPSSGRGGRAGKIGLPVWVLLTSLAGGAAGALFWNRKQAKKIK